MNVDRRQLALPALAIGLLGVMPAFAGADEDAVAKNLEAFRAAQASSNGEILASLCAAELSYSHSSGVVEDKATFIANATNGKSKWLSLVYENPTIRVVGPAAIVRFHWLGEQEAVADGKKSSTNLHILMNWQSRARTGNCCPARRPSSDSADAQESGQPERRRLSRLIPKIALAERTICRRKLGIGNESGPAKSTRILAHVATSGAV